MRQGTGRSSDEEPSGKCRHRPRARRGRDFVQVALSYRLRPGSSASCGTTTPRPFVDDDAGRPHRELTEASLDVQVVAVDAPHPGAVGIGSLPRPAESRSPPIRHQDLAGCRTSGVRRRGRRVMLSHRSLLA
ncbi:hypothetical protein HBB16_19770 [Pseudonocardia sp. MCCB 268]|nr:hypothetical protein [Pseudonocardia cytotoxica]